ncbi:VOC family protein [Spirosoma humi]
MKPIAIILVAGCIIATYVLPGCQKGTGEKENHKPISMSTNSYFRGIDHVGITVPDVNAASAFLNKALDAKTVYDVLPEGAEPFQGAETEQQLGIPQGSKIIHMRLMQIGNGPTLELFQFSGAEQKAAAKLNDYGLQHIAVYVDDIEKTSRQFEKAGGTLLSNPHPLSNVEDGPRNKGVYGKTPWGMLVELLTYPDGLKDKSLHRWTPEK